MPDQQQLKLPPDDNYYSRKFWDKFSQMRKDIIIMKQVIVCMIFIITITSGIAQAGQDITGEYRWNKGKKVIRMLTVTKQQGDTYLFDFYGIEDQGERSQEGGREFNAVVNNEQVRYNKKSEKFGMGGCNIVITFSNNIADVKGDCITYGSMQFAGMKYKKMQRKSK